MLSPVQLERASLPTSSQHLLQRYARNASWNNPTWIPFCSSVILLQLTKLTNKSYQSPSQDVAGKIAAFASQSPRAVCVLSAMGSVSRAVLRHPADHPPSYNNPSIYEVGDHPIYRGQIKEEVVQLRPICNPPWCAFVCRGCMKSWVYPALTIWMRASKIKPTGSASRSAARRGMSLEVSSVEHW